MTGRTGACPVCGVPGPDGCGVLADHLASLALRGHTAASIYTRQRAVTRMAALLPVPVLEAAGPDLAAWRAALDLTDGAVASYVSHAQQFYAWAMAEGLRDDNPAARLPKPRAGRRLPRPISEADLMYALGCAPARIRLWLILAGWCGLRAKEIALLRRESILDTASPPVLIVAANATKGRSERTVPLSAFVLAEIRAAALPGEGFAFRRVDGRPGPNQPWLVSRLANAHLHDCGISATLHQLRHRFGSQTYQASRDLRAVQSLLGHASPSTTAGYAAFSDTAAIAAVEALPAPRHLQVVRDPAADHVPWTQP